MKIALKIPLSALRWMWLGLVALQLLWFGWWAPPSTIPVWLAMVLMVLPLLVMLIPVWRLGIRALVVGGILLLLYFCLAVAEFWVNPAARLPAAIGIVLIALYYAGLARLRPQSRKRPAS